MFGLLLVFVCAVFNEVSTSIGKYEVRLRKESIYSLGFLDMVWGTAFFLGYALTAPNAFVFQFASLPIFALRLVFELLLVTFAVHAIAAADRSTFGFLRIVTVPLLLVVDFALGYSLTPLQTLGIGIIVVSFVVLFMNHGIRHRGAYYTIGAALLAVATISLYKYNITHYNTVAAEQGIMSLLILIFYYCMARFVSRENPFRLLKNPTMFTQSLASGVGSVFGSFAYLFAPASIIATADRAFALIASIVSGNLYFKERHLAVKLFSFALMAGGIVLLAF